MRMPPSSSVGVGGGGGDTLPGDICADAARAGLLCARRQCRALVHSCAHRLSHHQANCRSAARSVVYVAGAAGNSLFGRRLIGRTALCSLALPCYARPVDYDDNSIPALLRTIERVNSAFAVGVANCTTHTWCSSDEYSVVRAVM